MDLNLGFSKISDKSLVPRFSGLTLIPTLMEKISISVESI
jgi:hypothetical protein